MPHTLILLFSLFLSQGYVFAGVFEDCHTSKTTSYCANADCRNARILVAVEELADTYCREAVTLTLVCRNAVSQDYIRIEDYQVYKILSDLAASEASDEELSSFGVSCKQTRRVKNMTAYSCTALKKKPRVRLIAKTDDMLQTQKSFSILLQNEESHDDGNATTAQYECKSKFRLRL